MQEKPNQNSSNETYPDERLFDVFSPPTYSEWIEAAEKSLKGVPFSKLIRTTYEGIEIQPIYRQEDTADLDHPHTIPGEYPFVRGQNSMGSVIQPWLVAQELAASTPSQCNAVLRNDLKRGQTAVNLLLDLPTRAGLDPDEATAGDVGREGVSLATAADMETLFDGIDLAQTPLFVRSGTAALPVMALLAAYLEKQGVDTAVLQGSLEADPLGVLARRGKLPLALETAYAEIAELVRWTSEYAPKLAVLTVHGYPYANAGGSAVEELAFVLATAVTYTRELLERGSDINSISAKMQFALNLGNDFFMETAKLRAARILWVQIAAAFGGDEQAQKMTIHGRSARWNKTLTDAYVNMLRVTTEAFSGAVGGVDSMHVAPFDEEVAPVNEFSRRIARNVQIILQAEAQLTRVVDPAGGAYYVEYLTDQIARMAWALFQDIEAQGGMLAALEAGFPQQKIAETAAARAKNLARRKDVLVGTNMYANLDEEKPPLTTTDYEAIYAQRIEAVAAYRQQFSSEKSKLEMETAVSLAQKGATLGQLTAALRPESQFQSVEPVNWQRAAEPFEKLRANADAYLAENGRRPRVFLANMGPLRQYKARADFSRGFLEVGGFEIVDPARFDTPEAAAQAAIEDGAPVVVICSTDETYPDIVPPLVQAIREVKPETVVALAGYPKEQIAAHQAAGVDNFIFLGADCYAINAWLQTKINRKD